MSKTKIPLAEAEQLADVFLREAKEKGVERIQICGSIRRRESVVGDLDVVVEGDLGRLCSLGLMQEGGTERITLIYHGVQVNVFRSVPEEWGAAIFYTTGPASYQIGFRMKAKRLKWLLNQHGLFDRDGKKLAGETEEGIYAAFGKEWKAPERRGKK